MDNNKWTEDQQFSMGIVKIGGAAVKVEEEKDDGDKSESN